MSPRPYTSVVLLLLLASIPSLAQNPPEKPKPAPNRTATVQPAARSAAVQPSAKAAPAQPTAQPSQHVATQPAAVQPYGTQRVTPQPAATQPAAAQPSATLPSATQRVATQPYAAQYSATQPTATQSSVGQPTNGRRGVNPGAMVQQYSVPNFRDKSLQQVHELAVVPGTTRPLFASIIPTNSGTVVQSQDIAPGTMVVPGQYSLRVTFVASAPPSEYTYVGNVLDTPTAVKVPNVLGATLPIATRTIESLHLKPSVSGDRGGTVQTQDPAPGASVNEGSTVAVVFAASVKVPSVKGLTVADARQVLATASLRVGATRPMPAADDRVADQSPEPGASVPTGSQVNLVTVAPKSGLPVPSLIGDTQQAAAELLARVRLTPSFAGDRTGTVARQVPAAGTLVNAGATVTLYLHSLHVPNLVGLPLGQALRTLNAASLRPGSIGPTNGDNDQVVAQDTPAGSDVGEGARIGLTTRAAIVRITVPSVVGDTLDTAQSTLQSLHLTASYNGDAGATIRGQSPEAGSQVDQGALITLQMGTRNVKVPDVRKRTLSQAMDLLKSATLQTGSINSSHNSNAVVISQSQPPGTMVPQNTLVNLGTVAPAPQPQPHSQPTQPQPTQSQPTQSQPTQSQPTQPQPTQSQPTQPQPTQPQPTQSQPTRPQPTQPQPTQSQPVQSQPAQSQPTQSQPTQPQPARPGDNAVIPQQPSIEPEDAGKIPPVVQVPDLVTNKLSDAAASSELASKHLAYSFIGPYAGIAVWQDPPAYLMVPPGTVVRVQLEMPQVMVPNLRHDDAPTALQALSARHLQGSVKPARWSFLGPEKVVNQDPMPGSMTNEGSSVQVVMGSKPRPVVYAALIFLAGGLFLWIRPGKIPPQIPHPAGTPAVCTVTPEPVVPNVKVSSEGPAVRYAITVRERNVETHVTTEDSPAVKDLR